MDYTIAVPGFEGRQIAVRLKGIFSDHQLIVDGQPPQKGPKRGQMLLRRNDGMEVVAFWKPGALGLDVPQLVVDGQTYKFVGSLKWYEWIWGGLPILLFFAGGMLGAVTGLIAFAMNARIFRSTMETPMKYLSTAGISIAAVVLYIVLAVILFLVLDR